MKTRMVEIFEKVNNTKVEGTHNALVYGTLMDDKLLFKVLGHEVKTEPITIHNKKKVDYHTYLDLENGDEIIKAKCFPLRDGDLKKLDDWEEHYQRKKLDVDGKKYYYYSMKKKWRH